MAIAFDNTAAQGGIFDPVFNAMQALSRKHAARRAFRVTRRELMALSDHSLDDLGLCRSDIERAALEATIGFAHR